MWQISLVNLSILTGVAAAVSWGIKLAVFNVVHLLLKTGEVKGKDAFTDSNVGLYVQPRQGDSRSPCPALNTMANHGYLPRNGRNISAREFVHALQLTYNLSWPLAWFLALGGIILLGQCGRISLSDLARHNRVEHDASLAHANTGRTEEYAPTNVDAALFAALEADSASGKHLEAADIARARIRREAEPGTQIDALHQEVARGEVALVLSIFGDEKNRVPLEYVRSWWRDEHLPEGWAPGRKTTLLGTVSLSSQIRHAMNAMRSKA